MVDVGFIAGLRALWQQDLVPDLTVKVEDREFQVHKAILASVSEHVRSLLTGSGDSADKDNLDLKGLSAEAFATFRELLYTSKEDFLRDNAAAIHECSVYLKAPKITKLCVDTLVQNLTINNCLDALSTFLVYSIGDEVDTAKKFITSNWKAAVEHCEPARMCYEVLQFLLDVWQKSEFDRFVFLKDWLTGDSEKRKDCFIDLMIQIRFCLMSLEEVASIKEMDIFRDSDDVWKELVVKAEDYHKLPIYQKVLHDTEQSQVRPDPAPVCFTTGYWESEDNVYITKRHEKLDIDVWKKCKATDPPEYRQYSPTYIQVNNYLIMASDFDTHNGQEWHIFNPRTMAWYKMSNMHTQRTEFALVHHAECLYAVGGFTGPLFEGSGEITDGIEEYDFKTNTWYSGRRTPEPMFKHCACVLGNRIYVSGGQRRKRDESTRVDCLEIESNTWSRKASMIKPKAKHHMVVITVKKVEMVVVIDGEFQIEVYNPRSNQWSSGTFSFSETMDDVSWGMEGFLVARGNTVYLLYMNSDCVKWEFPERGNVIAVTGLYPFPVCGDWDGPCLAPYGAVLAVPQNHQLENVVNIVIEGDEGSNGDFFDPDRDFFDPEMLL